MISLAQLPRTAALAVGLLWVGALAGLVAFALAAGLHWGDPRSPGFQALYVCVVMLAATLCIARAALVPVERGVWALFGIGIAFWGGGYVYYFVALQHLPAPPYPSPSDALWLVFYGASFVALLGLMRARLARFNMSTLIDSCVGALALAAVAAALLLDSIVASTGGHAAAVITNLAYPVSDVHISGLVVGVFAMSGWKPGRGWLILGAAFGLIAIADTFYLYQTARGTYHAGTLLDVTWPMLMLAIAAAAWHEPHVVARQQGSGWPALAITSSFAVVALGLTTYDHWNPVSDVAFFLTTLTLVAAFARAAITFGEVKRLAAVRDLLVQKEVILTAAGEGIYGVGVDRNITFANPAALALTGHSPGEIEGRPLHATVHHTKVDGSAYPVEECPIMMSLEDGAVRRSDADVFWRKEGTSFPVEYTSTPILDRDRVTGAVVVFKDITERRLVERAKEEFTSLVSHELRTPLTSIRGSLGLLESGVLGPLPEKGQRMVQIAVQNTDRLVRLINDILDIERIGSGAIDMHWRPCDAAELIECAITELEQLASEAQVRLVADARPAALVADPDRVLQTLTNLISNAVKFSAAGSTVRVSSVRRDREVLFEVADRGRGIPAANLESIFERFQQVDASDSRDKGGTGLGLAICRTIVERHGGSIWVASELGMGSTFSFVLPLSRPDGTSASDRVNGGPAILVCDDDASVVEVVGAILEQRDYRVLVAHSGEQALALALAERPDAILLDLLMGGMGGWETAAALKEHSETEAIPIVILSVLCQDEADAPGAPIAGWLQKPLDDAALFEALRRALDARGKPFRVLIVEDDPDLRAVLIAVFERHGVETFCAAEGSAAIALSQRVMPDLLVLDVGLPGTDGFEVVDWLRRHKRLSALPMVVYTGRDLDAVDRERLRLGDSTEFVTKGKITPQDFEQRVMRLLARLTRERAPEMSHEPQAHPAGR